MRTEGGNGFSLGGVAPSDIIDELASGGLDLGKGHIGYNFGRVGGNRRPIHRSKVLLHRLLRSTRKPILHTLLLLLRLHDIHRLVNWCHLLFNIGDVAMFSNRGQILVSHD